MKLFLHSVIRTVILFMFAGCLSISSYAASPDIRFSSGKSALKIPFELHNNQIYLQITVNDSKPAWFILDTGAGNIISRSLAQKLGLKLQEQGEFQAPGKSGIFKYALTKKVSFKLPGAVLTDENVAVVAFEDVEKCVGHSTDGIIGFELFNSAVVEIDYKMRLLNIFGAKSYQYSGKGEPFPIETMSNGHVTVRANFTPSAGRAPTTGKFVVDTGFALSLLLNSSFIRQNKLLADGQGQPFTVCGFGQAKAIKDKVAALWLGAYKFENATAIFSQPQSGVDEHADVDGLLGGEFLSRYKVIFDYSRGRMILEAYPQS